MQSNYKLLIHKNKKIKNYGDKKIIRKNCGKLFKNIKNNKNN
jgi:hypothetical protein